MSTAKATAPNKKRPRASRTKSMAWPASPGKRRLVFLHGLVLMAGIPPGGPTPISIRNTSLSRRVHGYPSRGKQPKKGLIPVADRDLNAIGRRTRAVRVSWGDGHRCSIVQGGHRIGRYRTFYVQGRGIGTGDGGDAGGAARSAASRVPGSMHYGVAHALFGRICEHIVGVNEHEQFNDSENEDHEDYNRESE